MAKERESIRQFKLPPCLRLSVRRFFWLRLIFTLACTLVAAIFTSYFLNLPVVAVLVGTFTATIFLLGLAFFLENTSSSVMTDARLMALSARIRPHFLFNSLNAVLGTIRTDPRLAESALEELSDLFRAMLQDPQELVLLSEELALCRKYLALERLRLGDRVQVHWEINSCPPDALMPPLMLQPLIENAVYHGIEPLPEPGVIDVRLFSSGGMVVIELSNPFLPQHLHAEGNRIAINNIKERLELFYGQTATFLNTIHNERYIVRIVLPYQSSTTR